MKVGCILTPLLFNIHINSLIKTLQRVDINGPKLAERHILILLYDEDAVLFFLTSVSIKQALRTLASYYNEEQLIIIDQVLVFFYQKTKAQVDN